MNYKDIINLDRPLSSHEHISMSSRASQFHPFQALSGYDDNIKESNRITYDRIDVCDDKGEMINRKLNYIYNHMDDNEEVTITYFLKDSAKDKGVYVTKVGYVKRIDTYKKLLILSDNTMVEFMDILDMSINNVDMFDYGI